MMKKNSLIIFIIFILFALLLVSCNIFDWSTNIGITDPYDLVKAGDSELDKGTEESFVKASEFFAEAISKFESDPVDQPLGDERADGVKVEEYLYYVEYLARAYRGYATSELQQALPLELILNMITKLMDQTAREASTQPTILDYLLEDYDGELTPEEVEQNLYLGIVPKYKDKNGDYLYERDKTEENGINPDTNEEYTLLEKRGASTEYFEKAETLAHNAYIYGIEIKNDPDLELTADAKNALNRLEEASTNTAFDTVIAFSLSSMLLGLDSSFDFQTGDTDGDGKLDDYFSIKPDYTYSSRLSQDYQLLTDMENLASSYQYTIPTQEEIDEMKTTVNNVIVVIRDIKRFSDALFDSAERLAGIFDRFHERLESMNISEEIQTTLDQFLAFIVSDYRECTDPAEPGYESLYCRIKIIQDEIHEFSTAAETILTTLNLALTLYEAGGFINDFDAVIDALNDPDSDYFTEDDAQAILDLVSNEDCMVGDEIDFNNPGCLPQGGVGDEGDAIPGGSLDDAAAHLNDPIDDTNPIYDTLDTDDNTLPGEPSGAELTPNTNWKALEIISKCNFDPSDDECRFVDDLP